MTFVMWIVMSASRGASFRKVSELVNMHSMFTIWIQSFNRAGDLSGLIQPILTERYDSPHFGFIRIQYTDGMPFGVGISILVHEERTETQSCEYAQASFKHYYLWQLFIITKIKQILPYTEIHQTIFLSLSRNLIYIFSKFWLLLVKMFFGMYQYEVLEYNALFALKKKE